MQLRIKASSSANREKQIRCTPATCQADLATNTPNLTKQNLTRYNLRLENLNLQHDLLEELMHFMHHSGMRCRAPSTSFTTQAERLGYCLSKGTNSCVGLCSLYGFRVCYSTALILGYNCFVFARVILPATASRQNPLSRIPETSLIKVSHRLERSQRSEIVQKLRQPPLVAVFALTMPSEDLVPKPLLSLRM